jgi:CheY-like chemotaxis protein
VITDILMPKVDGFELTGKLKKDPFYKDVPIIIITTRENDTDKKRGLEVGADAYILKSEFTSDELLEVIERLIG